MRLQSSLPIVTRVPQTIPPFPKLLSIAHLPILEVAGRGVSQHNFGEQLVQSPAATFLGDYPVVKRPEDDRKLSEADPPRWEDM